MFDRILPWKRLKKLLGNFYFIKIFSKTKSQYGYIE